MLRHLFKLAWRNISRNKIYTAINILGLTLGISACIVIYFVASYDLSFDSFHQDKERIYRLGGKVQENNGQIFIPAIFLLLPLMLCIRKFPD